jgi:hypothetical protein
MMCKKINMEQKKTRPSPLLMTLTDYVRYFRLFFFWGEKIICLDKQV